jgi:hypothetical protein
MLDGRAVAVLGFQSTPLLSGGLELDLKLVEPDLLVRRELTVGGIGRVSERPHLSNCLAPLFDQATDVIPAGHLAPP